MLGVVNRLYDYMDRVLIESSANVRSKDWSDELYITRRDFQGGQFIGNDCSKLLDQVDILERMLIRAEAYLAIPYVQVFRALKCVKDACFGFALHPNYKKAIDNFMFAYLGLGIPVSPKVHIIFEHIAPFCEKYDKGLGWFAEHAVESCHYDYFPFWETSYKVSMNNPRYAEQLLNAIVMYNALHL